MANDIQTGQARQVHNVVNRFTINPLEVDQFQILKTKQEDRELLCKRTECIHTVPHIIP
jgi:hypothetical protein